MTETKAYNNAQTQISCNVRPATPYQTSLDFGGDIQEEERFRKALAKEISERLAWEAINGTRDIDGMTQEEIDEFDEINAVIAMCRQDARHQIARRWGFTE